MEGNNRWNLQTFTDTRKKKMLLSFQLLNEAEPTQKHLWVISGVWWEVVIAASLNMCFHEKDFDCTARLQTNLSAFLDFVSKDVSVLACAFLSCIFSLTYLSALTYSSSIGTQGTFPNLTPIWMSLNCRPRFSPQMVTLVPPWRGPVSGNN